MIANLYADKLHSVTKGVVHYVKYVAKQQHHVTQDVTMIEQTTTEAVAQPGGPRIHLHVVAELQQFSQQKG